MRKIFKILTINLENKMSCIDHDRKFIFIHIPKCAGTSMESVSWCRGQGHSTIRDAYMRSRSDHHSFNFQKYYKWCFVRNPWDRAFSAWDFHIKLKQQGINTFEKFINILHKEKHKISNLPHISWGSSVERPYINGFGDIQRIHFFPMLPLLKLDNKIHMDFIGKYESIQKDWIKIRNTVAPDQDTALPHFHNRKDPEPYASHYTAPLRDKVGEIYQEDIEYFNYKF